MHAGGRIAQTTLMNHSRPERPVTPSYKRSTQTVQTLTLDLSMTWQTMPRDGAGFGLRGDSSIPCAQQSRCAFPPPRRDIFSRFRSARAKTAVHIFCHLETQIATILIPKPKGLRRGGLGKGKINDQEIRKRMATQWPRGAAECGGSTRILAW